MVRSLLVIACMHPGGEISVIRQRQDHLHEWTTPKNVNAVCDFNMTTCLDDDICTPVDLTEDQFELFKEEAKRVAQEDLNK